MVRSRSNRTDILFISVRKTSRLLVDGRDAAFALSEVGGSVYADFTAAADGKVSMELLF